jgi:spore maturation protein CgeB
VFPGNVFGSEFARIVGESAVSLNLLRSQNAGAHNMRTFEIPAMGGVMLTTRSEEQQELFPDGDAALMFSNPDELRSGVERLLADSQLRQRLRIEGVRRAAAHTYDARAAKLLELIA